ncbi:MAG: hypothetical protein WAK56_19515 [Candidatus Sulfotelmatobacter sp.]
MRIRRTIPVVLGVLIVAAAITAAVQLRKLAPPEPARMLPGADAFFYVDLAWARRLNGGKELPAVSHDPEYEQFIQATGFLFERDLDEAAFAVHYPASWPGGGTGGTAPEPRFSEVLVGKFQSQRLTDYLRKIARSVESYHAVDIFTIPLEGRTLRVAVLSADSVAASNQEDAAVLQQMVDRSKKLASPFGGPALLREFYKHVQLGSLAWVIARIDPSAPGTQGWSSIFAHPTTVVISGSFLSPLHLHAGSIHLEAEAFTQNADEAHVIADKVTAFVALTHSAETSAGIHGTDTDVKALFDSLRVKQEGDRAVVSATMPLGFLRKMLSGSAAELNEPAEPPEQAPAKSP